MEHLLRARDSLDPGNAGSGCTEGRTRQTTLALRALTPASLEFSLLGGFPDFSKPPALYSNPQPVVLLGPALVSPILTPLVQEEGQGANVSLSIEGSQDSDFI